jgi:large subunit ribosomal protein L15e
MGYLKYVKQAWQDPKNNPNYRELLLQVRREPVTLRLERPTNIARARSLGYKPKQGVLVIRQRIIRGGKMRPDIKGGRRTAHSAQSKVTKKNYQQIAEERVQSKYQNCEVLNSYKLMDDGTYAWYEIILVDRMHPAVLADPRLAGVARQQGRVFRGLTSAGRRERGLRQKGIGAEKQRPSLGAKHKLH